MSTFKLVLLLLSPLLSHHPTFEFSSGFRRFPLLADRGRFEILAPFDLLHDSIALAFAFESTQRLFDGLIVA